MIDLLPPLLALSVQALNTIGEVEADDLRVMWTLFSKCKGQLEHGQRLENMAWRLWHHESSLTKRTDIAFIERSTVPVQRQSPIAHFLTCLATPSMATREPNAVQFQNCRSSSPIPTPAISPTATPWAEANPVNTIPIEVLSVPASFDPPSSSIHKGKSIETLENDTTFVKTQPNWAPRQSLLSLLLHRPPLDGTNTDPNDPQLTQPSSVGYHSESTQQDLVLENIQNSPNIKRSSNRHQDSEWRESFHGW
ncbi:hypothetical protein CLU79DRAFT_740157 [Phycomyces nitens]|nr:hypothetical protein CLU79DRAFT_740157 [Phycomyces nitens]